MRSFLSNHFIFFYFFFQDIHGHNGSSLKEVRVLDLAVGGLGVLASLLPVRWLTLDNPLCLSGFSWTRCCLRVPPDLIVCDFISIS